LSEPRAALVSGGFLFLGDQFLADGCFTESLRHSADRSFQHLRGKYCGKGRSIFVSDSPRDASTLCTEAGAGTFVIGLADKVIFEN
jgi:hypothetical protein